jgi:hypothetical protein
MEKCEECEVSGNETLEVKGTVETSFGERESLEVPLGLPGPEREEEEWNEMEGKEKMEKERERRRKRTHWYFCEASITPNAS